MGDTGLMAPPVWSPLPDHVTRKINVSLAGAPELTQDNITIAPIAATWYEVNGIPTRLLVEGRIVTGVGSRSGGSVVFTYLIDEQPAWLAQIMREAIP